jgi:hypothetical protein
MASQVDTAHVAAGRDRSGRLQAAARALARALPDHAPRGLALRALLAIVALAGAAWFVTIAVREAGRALGYSPAGGVAASVAAIILVPAAMGFAAPLLDAYLTLILGRIEPGTWSRIAAESLGALVLACCATVLDPRLWPGIGVLALVAVLGALFGLRRWQPQVVAGERPARLPLVLLLFDEPRPGRRSSGVASRPMPSEREAA